MHRPCAAGAWRVRAPGLPRLGQHRSTQRKGSARPGDEERLTDDIIELADQYGRYGYRMVTGLLNNCGLAREPQAGRAHLAARRAEGPTKAEEKGAALAERWVVRASQPERPNHVWSYDFVQDRTADGQVYRTLNIIDEYTREALMIRVDRKLNSTDVLDALTDLFILRGPPRIHKIGQWPGIYCPESAGLDRRRGRQDRLHRARITLGKWILRKLQRPVPR